MSKPLSDTEKIIPTVECLIVKDDKVLLMKRSASSAKFPGYWIGPGGHVDENEDVLSAAIRETEEETGIKIAESKISLKVVAIGRHLDRNETYMIYYFLAHLDSDQEIKNSEEGNSEWIPIGDIPNLKNLFPPFKYYVGHALEENSGILYTNVELRNLEIVNVASRRTDKDY